MQVLITSPAKRLPSTPTSLRRTRPSPEKLFVPSTIHFGPVRQSNPFSHITDDPFIDATEENQTSFALPLVKQTSGQINLSRRIEFTGFSLVENSMARSPRNDEEWFALSAAFPGAIGIQVNAVMIVVRYATLPEKPWPLSAGGLPVFITTDLTDSGFDPGKKGGNFKALDNYDVKDGLSEDLFQAAISYYRNEHGIYITSIVNIAYMWLVRVPDKVKLERLPSMLAKSPCGYEFESECERPIEAAFRKVEPKSVVRDLSRYQPLRPGVALSCANSLLGKELLTTSGVLVENQNEERFITVASHGFPSAQDNVFHPDDSGPPIGRIYERITDSDIAIARLSSSCSYVNQTFDCVTKDDSFLPGTKVTGIRDAMTMPFYEELTMNSPFSGYCTGFHIGMELRPIPSDEPVVPHKCCQSDWWYIGNGMDEPLGGTCGTVILDKEGKAVSFFKWLSVKKPGFATGVAASTLTNWGYNIIM